MPDRVFISHASADKATALALRDRFARHGLDVWIDARELAPGSILQPEIEQAIDRSAYVVVVLSPRTINSRWVTKEVDRALERQKKSGAPRVIPLLLDGLEHAALDHWFGEEPVASRVELKPGGIDAAMPSLLAALGLRAPTAGDAAPAASAVAPSPTADLVLVLTDPAIHVGSKGERRATAIATLSYAPPDTDAPDVASQRFQFTSPLGPIEAEDVGWYLERYATLPVAAFRDRAARVEAALPEWGKALQTAVLQPQARVAFTAWQNAPNDAQWRFVVHVDRALVAGSSKEKQAEADEAASLLLSLPWELLHDDEGYLFQGARGVRVCRRLPNTKSKAAVDMEPPLRVLLLSPRPSDEGYIDHRITARPVAEALGRLGELAQFKLLTTPTFAALEEELRLAHQAKKPYHVVHFDGHGVYNPREGLGALCFEAPSTDPQNRPSDLVDAERLAAALRGRRVPLFFLEACQSAQSRTDPTGSVAAKLLAGGVASVAAMSHSVLVDTARRFVTEFYEELVQGRTVAQAMLAGQRTLFMDPRRGKTFNGELKLQDWFVPVLYQEQSDPALVQATPSERVQEYLAETREEALGDLPDPPAHGFVGRSQELLIAERVLDQHGQVLIRGEGGEGKTALACELARWLVVSGRAERAAFVAFDVTPDAKAAINGLVAQLAPGEMSRAAQSEKDAQLVLERALEEHRTAVVLDNLESVLQGAVGQKQTDAEKEVAAGVLALITLLAGSSATCLVLTSREEVCDVPAIGLGRLSKPDAVALVREVLGEGGLMPGAVDMVESEAQIEDLVEAVGAHARALVLLTKAARERGVTQAARQVRSLAREMESRHPGERERSLLASVRLSLDRLTPETRGIVAPLAVVVDGVSLTALAPLLGADDAGLYGLVTELVGVGLATPVEGLYLRLDPALGPALSDGADAGTLEAARSRWAQVMGSVAALLYQQKRNDPARALRLARLEMPNMVAALEFVANREPAEIVVELSSAVEALAADLSMSKFGARAAAVREVAAGKLGVWSHAVFVSAYASVRDRNRRGRLAEAEAAARHLLTRCLAGGDGAFPEAPYDTAMAHFLLGKILQELGAAEDALRVQAEARSRFSAIAMRGDEAAAFMATAATGETANCLADLGRLDEAAALYEGAIAESGRRGNSREVAVGKGQLATTRRLQGRFAEAIELYDQVKTIFQRISEPAMVAVAWHQIAMVHKDAADYPAAEIAYHESLRIEIQLANRAGEATTLGELGILQRRMGRPEEAVSFYARAAQVFTDLGDRASEGRQRSNAAVALVELGRYAEARSELERAIDCNTGLGHAGEPWKTFGVLHKVESVLGDTSAAAVARSRAIDAYLAYRRNGGVSQSPGAEVFQVVATAVENGRQSEATALLERIGSAEIPAEVAALIVVLRRVLAGERDPSLADDPALHYMHAADLRLVLETLAGAR